MPTLQHNLGDVVTPEEATDPWLQRPDGTIVDLIEHLNSLPVGACGDCHGGLFAPTRNGPTEQGIERCDQCNAFEGDLDAAHTLAAIIGNEVTVWIEVPE